MEARRLELLGQVSTRAVREAAEALAARSVLCAPLKGALHAALDGPTRPYADVDLLVPEARFADADAALRALGYRPWSAGSFATAYLHPERPLPLDVHRRPFPWGLFRLDGQALLTRARRDAQVFGAPVLLLDPRDDYALVVGHFVKDRRDRRALPCLPELQRIRTRGGLVPEEVARHLEATGLARAGRYVHHLLAESADDVFAREVLEALGPDVRGERLAGLARAWAGRLPPRSRAAAPISHLLDASLPHGLRSLAAHAVDSARSRLPGAVGASRPRDRTRDVR